MDVRHKVVSLETHTYHLREEQEIIAPSMIRIPSCIQGIDRDGLRSLCILARIKLYHSSFLIPKRHPWFQVLPMHHDKKTFSVARLEQIVAFSIRLL